MCGCVWVCVGVGVGVCGCVCGCVCVYVCGCVCFVNPFLSGNPVARRNIRILSSERSIGSFRTSRGRGLDGGE